MPFTAALCVVFDFIEVDFINAGLGNLYNPNIYATLPQFLTYIDGSSEVFDNTSGSFIPIVAAVNGNVLSWDIVSLVDEFVPSEQHQPLNTIKIRYKVKADCGYASGSTIRYDMEGNLVCGRKTNEVSKVTGPLHIDGLSSESLIDLGGSVLSTNCNGDILLRVDVDKTTAFEPGILNITIPLSGVLISTTTSLPLIINGNKLTLELPNGIYQESFEIFIKLDSSIICSSGQFELSVSVLRNADCQSQSCQAEVIVNNFVLPFSFDTPDYEIQSFTIDGSNAGFYQFGININKTGGLGDSIIFYKLVLDDGDGIYNGDSIIANGQSQLNIGENKFLVSGIQLSLAELCNLMIVIDTDLNCICIPVSQSLNKIRVTEEYQSACQGDSINIGIAPIQNAIYNWSPIQGLSCQDCPENNILIETNEIELLYNLTIENPDGCEIQIDYPILVNSLPEISNPSLSSCSGDTIVIVTNGDSIMFSGAGIIEQLDNTLTIIPLESGLYIGTLTDDNGCKNIDTAHVTVMPSPKIETQDLMFCYGQIGSITVEGSDTLDYHWTNGLNRLEDVFDQTTSILIQENFDYLILVSNGTCTVIDTVKVTYFDGLDVDFMLDTIDVCLNGKVDIQLPFGYNYQWSLEEYITCLNSECSSVTYSNSGGSDVFSIVASNSEGCEDTLFLVIRTLTGGIEMEEVFFCIGDSVLHGNEYIFDEQTICDTTILECEYISCVTYRHFSGNYFDFYEAEIEQGDSIDLELEDEFNIYQWADDPTLSCLNCPIPNAKPLETTTYELEALDDNNCPIIIRYNVIVNTQCNPEDILIPNAFTPDGNGENDVFKVANLNVNDSTVQSFRIYNEWGMEVLNINSNAGWDGYFDGAIAAPGTYVYIIQIDCGTGLEKFVGSITLIR
jgi:gliding motility-associated-like protein